jgi:hypothetical protein
MNDKINFRKAFFGDFNKLKIIMNNEEILERKKYGYNFDRAFLIYKILSLFPFFTKILLRKEVLFLIIEKDGKVLGGLRCLILWNKKITNFGYVAIKKENRGQELGTMLLHSTFDYLKKKI